MLTVSTRIALVMGAKRLHCPAATKRVHGGENHESDFIAGHVGTRPVALAAVWHAHEPLPHVSTHIRILISNSAWLPEAENTGQITVLFKLIENSLVSQSVGVAS